jgi:hypothetical protein
MTTDADTVARDVAAVAANLEDDVRTIAAPSTSVEVIAEVMDRVDAFGRRARQVKDALESAMIEHITATGNDVTIGDRRYYVGVDRSTKCVSNEECTDSVFSAVGWDVKQFAACLAANAFKASSVRSVLPEGEYLRLFETTEKPELREGKPSRKLKSLDVRYVR